MTNLKPITTKIILPTIAGSTVWAAVAFLFNDYKPVPHVIATIFFVGLAIHGFRKEKRISNSDNDV